MSGRVPRLDSERKQYGKRTMKKMMMQSTEAEEEVEEEHEPLIHAIEASACKFDTWHCMSTRGGAPCRLQPHHGEKMRSTRAACIPPSPSPMAPRLRLNYSLWARCGTILCAWMASPSSMPHIARVETKNAFKK